MSTFRRSTFLNEDATIAFLIAASSVNYLMQDFWGFKISSLTPN